MAKVNIKVQFELDLSDKKLASLQVKDEGTLDIYTQSATQQNYINFILRNCFRNNNRKVTLNKWTVEETTDETNPFWQAINS